MVLVRTRSRRDGNRQHRRHERPLHVRWSIPSCKRDHPHRPRAASEGLLLPHREVQELCGDDAYRLVHLTYGKLFKLQSDELDWLVVTAGDTAYVQGSASIRGEGSYPFRATIRDGAAAGSPDRLLLEVWASSSFVETGPTIYRASGDAGGQIQIQR